MRHNALAISSLVTDPTFRHVVGTMLTLTLAVVVKRADEIVYMEWPEHEPMSNVLALMQRAEVEHQVVFDVEDPNLWEYPTGGYRLWGMLKESLT